MGRLIKNHWARLICMAAASYQIAAAIEGFFWPKFFFDWLTKNFDGAVKPIPILQIINLVFGIIGLMYEWPLGFVAGTSIQRSLVVRLFWLPLTALTAVLLYQGTNAAIYYMIGYSVYMWAYSEGEVRTSSLRTLPGTTLSYSLLTITIGHLCRSLDASTQADAFDASETTLIYFVFYDSLDYAFFWRSSWFGGISVITNS